MRADVLRPFEENREYMDKRVNDGIEQYRKGDAKITLVDRNGKPVENAHFDILQTKHDFKYGANLFMLDEFDAQEQNSMYAEYFRGIFNMATLPFYWSDIEPQRLQQRYAKDAPKIYRRPSPELCLEYCDKFGIEPKAHCLNYEQFTPEWLKSADAQQYEKELERRMGELSERFAKRIPIWEVTNETLCHEEYHSAMFRKTDFMERCFSMADRFFPNNRLMINECWAYTYDNFDWSQSAYFNQVAKLLEQKQRVDMVGMQYHMFFRKEEELQRTAKAYDPMRLYDYLDYYAQLGRQLQITELTIPAYSEKEEDEEIQAQIIKNLYSIWFSHPAMSGIVYWNLIDGFAAFAPKGDMTAGENYYYGGLLRYDFTPKPAYRMIYDLFNNVWRTKLSIDAPEGQADFRGFYGDYTVKVTADERIFSSDFTIHQGEKNELLLTLPE